MFLQGEAKRTQKGPNPNKPATTYTCAICGATFAKVAQRNKHINDNHSLLTPPAPTTVIEPPKTKKFSWSAIFTMELFNFKEKVKKQGGLASKF